MGLKPKVRIVCPECEIPMKFTCLDVQTTNVSWVLSAESRKHLAEAHPPRPKLYVVEELAA